MSAVENISKMCRVCCIRQTSDNLIFLLDAENKTIVKKLRACADITVSTKSDEKSVEVHCVEWLLCFKIDQCVSDAFSLFSHANRLNQTICCQSTFVRSVYKT